MSAGWIGLCVGGVLCLWVIAWALTGAAKMGDRQKRRDEEAVFEEMSMPELQDELSARRRTRREAEEFLVDRERGGW